MTSRRSETKGPMGSACLDVTVNGKHVAKVGMTGEGGAGVYLSASRRDRPTAGKRARAATKLEMHLRGSDQNDPVWDRFYEWPTPRLRVGDEFLVRVEDGVPDKPRFRSKLHRFGEDQMPSPANPTFVVVRNVSVWADKWNVLLSAYDKGTAPRLTANGARKVAKALFRAADELERRGRAREKERNGP